MFKENNQFNLFTFENELPKKLQGKLADTAEAVFNRLIFHNIKESDYKVLYSEKKSRPNVAVNILVSALILKEYKKWSIEDLMGSVLFDMRTKVAIGLGSIDEIPFSKATLFNFQIKLKDYMEQEGINLLELTFDNLTAQQLRELKIKTDIQRTDSTLIGSNIKRYGRVELLVAVLLRFIRILNKEGRETLPEKSEGYAKAKNGQEYVYSLVPDQMPHELEKLGLLYKEILNVYRAEYSQTKEFSLLERAYKEHFVEVDSQPQAKDNQSLKSSMLQSPDDPDSPYRKKGKEQSTGTLINGTETANPENIIQLVCDVAVDKNNVDDSKSLENRLDKMVEKTPDLKEIHTDGGYGSEGVDKKMEEHNIVHVTTAIRGRDRSVAISIDQNKDKQQEYTVECPNQKIKSSPTTKKNKVKFSAEKCRDCALNEKCRIFKKDNGRFYFTHSDYLQNQRGRNILKIPKERRKIRPNVEALMKEFKCRTNGGKLKVRGEYKANQFAFSVAIGINFGRIYRLKMNNPWVFDNILSYITTLSSLVRKLSSLGANYFNRCQLVPEFFVYRALVRS
jgi:hypothetical protein